MRQEELRSVLMSAGRVTASVALHPDTERIYDSLSQRGTAPPLPREYGLRLVDSVLRAADHIRLLRTQEEEKRPQND